MALAETEGNGDEYQNIEQLKYNLVYVSPERLCLVDDDDEDASSP